MCFCILVRCVNSLLLALSQRLLTWLLLLQDSGVLSIKVCRWYAIIHRKPGISTAGYLCNAKVIPLWYAAEPPGMHSFDNHLWFYCWVGVQSSRERWRRNSVENVKPVNCQTCSHCSSFRQKSKPTSLTYKSFPLPDNLFAFVSVKLYLDAWIGGI